MIDAWKSMKIPMLVYTSTLRVSENKLAISVGFKTQSKVNIHFSQLTDCGELF